MTSNTNQLDSPTITIHHELVDWIIDFLHDDMKTLRACSLVSHDWLQTSSFHLFSRLRWPPCGLHQWEDDAEGMFQPCKCHMLSHSNTLGDLMLLLAGSSRIASHVRELCVKMLYSRPRLDGDYGPQKLVPGTTSTSEIALILQLAPHVEVLRIFHLALTPDALPPAESARSLRTLELTMPISQSITCLALLTFLSHFRAISELNLLKVLHSPKNVPVALQTPARRIPISALHVFFLEMRSGGGWLLPLSAWLDTAALTALTVRNIAFGHADMDAMSPALHGLLHGCTSLRTLTCVDKVSRGLLSYPGPCPTLRKLCFETEYVFSHSSQPLTVFVAWGTFMDLLHCPLAATVQDVACNLTFVRRVDIFEGVPAEDVLARELQNILEGVDWSALGVLAGRLRSFALDVKVFLTMDIFKLTAQRAQKATRKVVGGISEQNNGAILKDVIEEVVKGKMGTLPAQRVVHVDVSLPIP